MILEIETNAYTIHESAVSAEGYGIRLVPGAPGLPVKSVLIAVPPTGTLTAEVIESAVSIIPDVELKAESWKTSMLPPDHPPNTSPSVPQGIVRVKRLGLMRDMPVASVEVHPFAYNASQRNLLVYSHIRLSVRFHAPRAASAPRYSPPRPVASFDQDIYAILVNHKDAAYWRTNVGYTVSRPVSHYSFERPACRILIRQDGLYRITGHQFVEAGIDIRTIDPRTFAIDNKGQPVAIFVEGETDGRLDEDDAIEFYGMAHRQTFQSTFPDMYQDPYTDINVYWLSWGETPGPRIVREQGGIRRLDPAQYHAPAWYESTMRFEQNLFFDRLGGSITEMSDHWLWEGVGAGQARSYTITLQASVPEAPSPVILRGMFHGRSHTSASPDHHVVLEALDGALTTHASWDGITPYLAEVVSHDATARLQDTMAISVRVPDDLQPGGADFIALNWLEVEYPRAYQAIDDRILFSKPENSPLGLYQFTLHGFTNRHIQVYKIGVSELMNIVIEPEGEGDQVRYRAIFQTPIQDPDARFLALTPDQKRAPFAIQYVAPQRPLAAPSMGADYIIITHDAFYETAQRLADYRSNLGLRVETVKVSEIYDQFNYGLYSPDAIRRFLKYAYANWSPAPAYVLLVGDGRIDTREPFSSFIPVNPVKSLSFGVIGSDHPYALVSGDDQLPDLAIGRFPVRSIHELDTMIDKTIAYEASPEWGAWRRRLLFVSGDQRGEFEQESETLIRNYVPDAFTVSRLPLLFTHAGEPDFDTVSKQRLVTWLNEGVGLLNYIGHGGGGTWSDRNIWAHEDIGRMTNGRRLPIIVSMTCFTGSFEGEQDGLGERFVKTPERGAVAFFGSTGAGWLHHDFYVNESLFHELFHRKTQRIGRMLAHAKTFYLGQYGTGLQGAIARSQVSQYLLLGDPALAIGLPQSTIHLGAAPDPAMEGEALRIEGTIHGSTDGFIQLDAYGRPDASEEEALRTLSAVPVNDGSFTASLSVPERLPSDEVFVKAYHHSPSEYRDGYGAVAVTTGRTAIRHIVLSPSQPVSTDSVAVTAEIRSRDEITAVFCLWSNTDETGSWRRISMASLAPDGIYHTLASIPPQPPGASVSYRLSVVHTSGDTVGTAPQTYRIRLPADLTVLPSDITLGGRESVQLQAWINNTGDVDITSVPVQAWLHTADGDRRIGEQIIPSVLAGGRTQAIWTYALPSGRQRISITIDPDRTLNETNRINNLVTRELMVNRFNITPEAGSTVDGATSAFIPMPEGGGVFGVEPDFVAHNTVLSVTSERLTPAMRQQPDVAPISLSQSLYRFILMDSSAHYEAQNTSVSSSMEIPSFMLTLSFDPNDSIIAAAQSRLSMYRWAPEIERWIRLESQVDSTSITAPSAKTGLFGLFFNHDHTPPAIEIMADKQPLIDGVSIAPPATLSAVVQDANGVNTVGRSIEIELDGEKLPADRIVYEGTPENANSIPVSYLLPLSPGEHSIAMKAADCNGNESVVALSHFIISVDFDMKQIGNYPNPMQDYTIFTYRLTHQVDEFNLRIYTVDGRHVRTFSTRDATASGTGSYHEIVWDGTDYKGHSVSNGVYFYRLTTRKGPHTMKRTMKLAVLR